MSHAVPSSSRSKIGLPLCWLLVSGGGTVDFVAVPVGLQMFPTLKLFKIEPALCWVVVGVRGYMAQLQHAFAIVSKNSSLIDYFVCLYNRNEKTLYGN